MNAFPVPRRIIAAALLCMALAALVYPLGEARSDTGRIMASQILNFQLGASERRFGSLEFVGGLQLSSDLNGFGGFSGLRLYAGRDRMIAVTDRCLVLTAKIERDVTGAPVNISNALLRPLPPDSHGKPLSRSRYRDCEAIALKGPDVYIAFERNSQTARFTAGANGALSNFTQVWPRPGIGMLVHNRGIEAIALFPDGSPFAGSVLSASELTLDAQGNHRAFINGEGGVLEFAIARRDDYSVTDADFLPNGDLVILERRFGLDVAPGMRIRRIRAADIEPGRTVDGTVLMEAGLAYRIDNMEGLSVSTREDGQVYLTLISDDNFMYFQSTLLLEFKLAGEFAPVSAPQASDPAPRL